MILPLNVFYRMDFWKKLGHINEVFPGVLYVQEGNRMENRGETYRKEEKLYTVGEVCEQMGITRKTLFYYDQIGLLKPSERVSSQQVKLYDNEKIARLRCILQYREAGLRISEIRELLDDQNVHRLSILQTAMTRLQKERDGVEQEIVNLTKLIEAEKRATSS
ncbi:MerR family transcriptional regulator [Oribacterium sp. P9]|uniref:MerR family transcriptional regulator n=1 Tax=Oribacterium sp. P9 TaxID=3378068 RepID=UPI0039677730